MAGGRLQRALQGSGGYGTLQQILAGQGATDPRLMNRNLADIALQNQEQMRQAQGQLAAGGLNPYGSMGQYQGAGGGLLAAIGQGGAQMRSDYLAREAALQEQRKREDLMNLLLGPKFQRAGLRNQMAIARMQAAANQRGGFDWGGLLGLAGTAAGAYFGGPAGAAAGGAAGNYLGNQI